MVERGGVEVVRRRGRPTSVGTVLLLVFSVLAIAAGSSQPAGALEKPLDLVALTQPTGGMSSIQDVAASADGSSYVGGTFTGTIGLGSSSLTSAAGQDAFVARVAADGTTQWALRISDGFANEVFDIATDAAGNAYVAALLRSGTIGAGAGAVTVAPVGSATAVLFKVDSSGAIQWVRRGTATSFATVVVTGTKVALALGSVIGTPAWDDGLGGTISSPYALIAFDLNGTLAWTGSGAAASSIATGLSGNILAIQSGGAGFSVGRYDAATGTQLASYPVTADYSLFGVAVATDSLGRILIAGRGGEGDVLPGGTTLTSSSTGFLLVLDAAGAPVWGRLLPYQPMSIAVGPADHPIVGGTMYNTTTVGTAPDTMTLVLAGTSGTGTGDGYFVEFETNGTLASAQRMGGAGNDAALDVATDAAGALIVVGKAIGPATFGVGTDTVTSSTTILARAFVARFLGRLTGNVSDLALTMDISPVALTEGGTATATVRINNTGADPAPAVTVAVPLPSNATLLTATPSAGTYASPTWTVGALPPGSSATLVLSLQTAAGPGCDRLTLGADISSSGLAFDTNPPNDHAGTWLRIDEQRPVGTDVASLDEFAASLVSADVAVNGSGYTAIAGVHWSDLTIGSGPGSKRYPGRGLVVAVFAPDGSLQWSDNVDNVGVNYMYRESVGIDPGGNVTLAGDLIQSATIGANTPSPITLTEPSYGVWWAGNMFLARYTSTGTPVWLRHAGLINSKQVTFDDQGNSYAGGYVRYPTTFGDDGSSVTIDPAGRQDLYVAKFGPSGSVEWVRRGVAADTSWTSTITALVADGTGVTVAGVHGAVSFEGATPMPSLTGQGLFLARYNADGTLSSTQELATIAPGQLNSVSIEDIAEDTNGDLVLGGSNSYFPITFTGGPVVDGTSNVSGWVAHLTPGSAVGWATRVTGVSAAVTSVGVRGGVVHAVGQYQGAGTIAAVPLPVLGTSAVTQGFVASFDANGAPTQVRTVGGSSGGQGLAVASAMNGEPVALFNNGNAGITIGLPTSTTVCNVGAFAVHFQPRTTGSITGTVTDANTGLPVAGVLVTLMGSWPSWQMVATTTTGADGTYAFPPEPAGTYRVRFWDPYMRYQRTWFNQNPTYQTAQDITLTSGAAVADQALMPASSGFLAGWVQDSVTGSPVRGAVVHVFSVDGYVAGASVQTNGSFSVRDLAPGNYWIRYVDPSGAHLSQWHRNAATYAAAQTVTIAGGPQLVMARLVPKP